MKRYNFHEPFGRIVWKALQLLCKAKIHLYEIKIDDDYHSYYECVMMSWKCRLCKYKGYCKAPVQFQKEGNKEEYTGVIDGY